MQTEKAIARTLVLFRATWPNHKFTKETAQVYKMVLQDVPGQIIQAAATQCLAECDFFPVPAEVRRRAVALMTPAYPSEYEAWGEIERERRRVLAEGFQFSTRAEWSHAFIDEALQNLGGFVVMFSEDSTANRMRFVEAYREVVRKDKAGRLLPPKVRELRDGMARALPAGDVGSASAIRKADLSVVGGE